MPITWTAKRIKKMREITRRPQETFAGLAGVSRVTVSNWESEFKSPSLRHQAKLDELATEFGITQRQLDR